MKLVMFLILTTFLVSCATTNRQLASTDEERLYQSEERYGDYGAGYRQ